MSYVRRHRRTALGDSTSTMSQEDWQQQMLSTSQNQFNYLQQAIDRDHKQKWVAIAVTASIPVFGMLWKAILGRRRARMSL